MGRVYFNVNFLHFQLPKKSKIGYPNFALHQLISLHYISCYLNSNMDTTLEARTKICTLYQYSSKLRREVARIVGVSQRTVSNIIKLGTERETLHAKRKGKCGRKARANSQVVKMIVEGSVNDLRQLGLG